MLQFHFKKPLTQVLSRILLRTFPGIDKVWMITEDIDKEVFKLYETNNDADLTQFVGQVEIKKNNFLNTKHFYKWISLDETPLSADKETRMQYNIFDEYQNRILHLYLPPADSGFMLFYIFFNDRQAVTGPHTDNRLSTENKQLVAHTIYHLLRYERERYEQDNNVARNIQQMQSRITGHRGDEHLKNFVEVYIHDYLAKIQKQYGIELQISKEAIKYLTEQNLTPAGLTQLLDEAVSWMINFAPPGADQFTIEASHVVMKSNAHEKQELVEHNHHTKYNRTYDLLEKLETAGKRVIQNGQKLTGTNVGHAFEPPISAPAITDALRKHAKKIRTLAQLYPDRWAVMRNQFKPLQNVLDDDTADTIEAIQSA